MSTQLTLEQLQTAMPTQIKGKVTQDLVNTFNSMTMDDEFREHYRNNLISYTSVMQDGKFTMEQYLNAVRYVSFKLMGDTNIKSYMRTFPTKYSGFKAKGVKDKDIASYVTAYNKSKLVNLIYEQSIIPTHVLNADMFQEALNVQADLMINANSEKVRSDAANSLLTHLKPPEKKKLEIEVSQVESSVIDDLRLATQEHAKVLKQNIAAGAMSVRDAAQGDLVIAGECEIID
tara:strand:+ start:434 stop:1129 length:696 start_codon:yes stop_codon:yes gene_type:complete